jgi:hypothetical protein
MPGGLPAYSLNIFAELFQISLHTHPNKNENWYLL